MMTQPFVIMCRIAAKRTSLSGRRLALVTAVLLALAPVAGLGHGGELELSVSPSNIAAGDEVTISGEGFAASAALELHLTGPNGDAHFGDVTANNEGEFTQPVRIPGDVVPGLYLLRAESAAQEASAEVTVGAMAGMAETISDGASERDRSVAWQSVALVLFLGLGALGFALVRSTDRGPVAPSPPTKLEPPTASRSAGPTVSTAGC